MYRVRLASGEEAVYRSVDELALGIRSGVVSSDASVFDADARQWTPITTATEYAVACERAATLVLDEEPASPETVPTMGELLRGGPVPLYQMVSQSARELAARKRPWWILPGTSAVAFLVFVLSLVLVLRPRKESFEEVVLPKQAPKPAVAVPAPAGPASLSSALNRRLDPYTLAEHLARAGQAISSSFAEQVSAIELGDLLAPTRLSRPESLAVLLDKLQTFRTLRTDFRRQAGVLEQVYEDSARAFVATGYWARMELVEWHARLLPLEGPADAARTDRVLAALDRLYTVLRSEQGRFAIEPGGIRFAGGGQVAQEYALARRQLTSFASLPGSGERLPASLQLLVLRLGPSTLPPLSD